MGILNLAAIFLVGAAVAPTHRSAMHDRVDLIEVNHFYDECGNHILDQVIFYDWSFANGRFHVRDWRLLKSKAQWPVYDPEEDRYLCIWHDGTILRQVEARDMRETWTQHDPEVVNRKYLPRSGRQALRSSDSKPAPRPR